MEKLKPSIFRLLGSYIGLFVGLIISLQIKNNRMFLLEGKTDLDCGWVQINGISCSNITLISIILLLVAGFIIGGFIHKRQK